MASMLSRSIIVSSQQQQVRAHRTVQPYSYEYHKQAEAEQSTSTVRYEYSYSTEHSTSTVLVRYDVPPPEARHYRRSTSHSRGGVAHPDYSTVPYSYEYCRQCCCVLTAARSLRAINNRSGRATEGRFHGLI